MIKELGGIDDPTEELSTMVAKLSKYTVEHLLHHESKSLDEEISPGEDEEPQEEHRESSSKEGLVRDFLEKQVPLDWDKRSISERRLYWSGSFAQGNVELVPRDRVCAAEIWCECLSGDIKYMKRTDGNEITGILANIPGWDKCNKPLRFGIYGVQRGFIRRP